VKYALVLVAVETAEHPTDHGNTNKVFVLLRQFFVVSTKAPGIFKPGKSSLWHPAPRQKPTKTSPGFLVIFKIQAHAV
jgi:hypothetical protein